MKEGTHMHRGIHSAINPTGPGRQGLPPPPAAVTIAPVRPFHVLPLLLLALLLLFPLPATAQPSLPSSPPPPSQAQPVSTPEVFLLTIGVGPKPHELFGHNALAVYDPLTRTGVAYNWGVFDFNQKNFFARFATGRMLYTMQAEDLGAMIDAYGRSNRSVTLRRLNLSPQQTARLVDLCRANDTPGNRDYRYDYFRDNCSTRVRDMIDRATDGAVAAALKPAPAGTTYARECLRLSQSAPAVFAALAVFMGGPTEAPLSRWDDAFLPARLDEYLAQVGLADRPSLLSPPPLSPASSSALPSSPASSSTSSPASSPPAPAATTRPLAGKALLVAPSTRVEPAADPTPQVASLPAFLSAVGAMLLAAFGFIARAAPRHRLAWIPEKLLLLGVLLWAGLAGTLGLLIVWLWAFTDHWATRANLNLLALSPLSAVMVPLAVWLFVRPGATRVAVALARLAVLVVLGVAIQIGLAEGFRTALVSFVTLPLHIGTAVGLALLMKAKLALATAAPTASPPSSLPQPSPLPHTREGGTGPTRV